MTFAYKEMEKEKYDRKEFVNKDLEAFKTNPTNDYSQFYRPLLTMIENTIPYLEQTSEKLTGQVEYIGLEIKKYSDNKNAYQEEEKNDYEYIQTRMFHSIIWIQKRLELIEGKKDKEK